MLKAKTSNCELTKSRIKMNPSIVRRMYDETPGSFGKKVRMSKREFKSPEFQTNHGKNMALFAIAAAELNVKKNRNINSLKLSNFERRKQHKVRRDTWRRTEMPTEEDARLENIHYANFLGDKYGDNNAPYNSEYTVNLRFCDSMAEYQEPASHMELDHLARGADVLDGCESIHSYFAPYVYASGHVEEDEQSCISELSLGSGSELWLHDGVNNEYKEPVIDEQTMLYKYCAEQIDSAFEIYNRYEYTITIHNDWVPAQNQKRGIDEAYEGEPLPIPTFKRATCDDDTHNDWEPAQNQKRGIDEAYEGEPMPKPTFKRARCDDETHNV